MITRASPPASQAATAGGSTGPGGELNRQPAAQRGPGGPGVHSGLPAGEHTGTRPAANRGPQRSLGARQAAQLRLIVS